ncbi:MAG TPA: MmgE/PrpD family protein [Dehalococcoidia bacterium]|nr:MmgE/PrpD family protein [Dehalococcoidia bacterium]
MGTTEQLVNSCSSLTYEDLSPEVIDRVKYHALDFLGVAARGSLTESAKAVYDLIEDMGLNPQGGVIIGTDMRAPHHYAALANGTSAHSLELDDVNNEASAHPGVAIFPAAFASAELAGCGGKRFIEGVILGYEVMIRLGKALNPAHHYARGFHPTGTCGAFGAAVAASKILSLDKEQMLNALGIVGSQASGSMEFLTSGAWTKRIHPGWAAHNGIIAALLAKRGFKGPSTIIEGRFGFLHSYSDGSDLNKVLADFGAPFEIMKTSIKPHACCRYKQGPIDGILKIMKENNLKAQEIKEAVLGILKTAFPIIVEPRELKYNPKTVVDAQFSMPFGAAVAILHGKAALDEYTEENIHSPEVRDMMGRVSCVQDPELDKAFPRQWPASVEVVTKDGRRFSTRIEYPKGDPENPLTWEELLAKFHDLASAIYPEERRQRIISRVRALEQEENIRDFCRLVAGKNYLP